MAQVNPFLQKFKKKYFFASIAEEVAKVDSKELINLGIGDVARPLKSAIFSALHKASEELTELSSMKGYGPATGYSFLKKAIIDAEYHKYDIVEDEIFISDGACPDISNFQELFSIDNTVGILNPTYPLYRDVNQMAGRKIVDIPCLEENGFIPSLPDVDLDIIYLCSPNNPTGIVLDHTNLKKWVDYALERKALILFDGAYESFIQDPSLPKSIYEVPGAKQVAVEFRSLSKSSGFTSLRSAYCVVPKELQLQQDISLHSLWKQRQETKSNGIAYPIQKAAAAALSEEGLKQTREDIAAYMELAKEIKSLLQEAGHTVYGGENAPYLWWKTPSGYSSWEFFEHLLHNHKIVCIPGEGFGTYGESYVRLSSFLSPSQAPIAKEKLLTLR